MKSIIVDTNILLYALDSSSSYNRRAIDLLDNQDLRLFVTSKNISEYFAVCSKFDFDFSSVHSFYKQICQNTDILFPSVISLAIFENLLHKYKAKGNQIFDLEIVSIALASQVPDIATFNTKDFSRFKEISLYTV